MKRIALIMLAITALVVLCYFTRIPVPPECAGKTICFFIIH